MDGTATADGMNAFTLRVNESGGQGKGRGKECSPPPPSHSANGIADDANYICIALLLAVNFDECLIESNEPLTTTLLKFTVHID